MKPTRAFSPHGTYFISTNAWSRRPIFGAINLARIFFKSFYLYRAKGAYLIHEFVLMPDHLHAIVTPAPHVTLERAVQYIKGGASWRLKAENVFSGEVWQPGFTDHRIRDAEDYAIHRRYIRNNPVKRRLAEWPEQYPYCSAYPGYKLDAWPPSAAEAAHSRTP